MSELDLIKIFTDRLNQADIGYFVTGSVASIIYGEPRLTHDIDLMAELDRKDASRVVGAFPLGGVLLSTHRGHPVGDWTTVARALQPDSSSNGFQNRCVCNGTGQAASLGHGQLKEA
jgi:hypothetical protein